MFVDNFKAFLAQPFKADQNALHWLLLVGFLMICFAFWKITFSHIEA